MPNYDNPLTSDSSSSSIFDDLSPLPPIPTRTGVNFEIQSLLADFNDIDNDRLSLPELPSEVLVPHLNDSQVAYLVPHPSSITHANEQALIHAEPSVDSIDISTFLNLEDTSTTSSVIETSVSNEAPTTDSSPDSSSESHGKKRKAQANLDRELKSLGINFVREYHKLHLQAQGEQPVKRYALRARHVDIDSEISKHKSSI